MNNTFSSSFDNTLLSMKKMDHRTISTTTNPTTTDSSTDSTTAHTTSTTTPLHLYNTSCTYCHYSYPNFHDDIIQPTTYSSGRTDDDTPFQYNYLLSLFTSPDMVKHLTQASISEDVSALPIHLQRLISEAKEEVVLERIKAKQYQQEHSQQEQPLALIRLERVRNYVRMQSGGDTANLMMTLTELMSDEDELENVLGI
ncbi:hypothetical protein BDA99DRAFT_517281 [Phascolomyces articulosus]|uniref:Uncharacterized protein n=1 Tax=Phascolomyces articulosus TaxID=60185 RepID=A0AAD5K4I9_9FUNG|nr:hypothetical protein BDA99DRAFT_517281 [Phascolomyces articulosus]